MAVFKILRTHTIIDEYYVEADSAEKAMEKFNLAESTPEESWESNEPDKLECIKYED